MMEKDREIRQMRCIASDFTTRAENDELIIEGYFAVFNSNYDIAPGMSESIAPGAFKNTLSGDIRALVNHDTTLVLGRNTARTLELSEDERGLWGRIRINPNDTDATNLYARVERGDVSQCSIGFDILDEETEFLENGEMHWTIKEVKLYEVSCCTFPAYESTNIDARARQRDDILKRRAQEWREKMKERLKNGTQSIND
jgi:HK97 family phage prohead protease